MHNGILIRVRGLRAERIHTCDLATGNNAIKVRFDLDPEDPVWADKVLSASFEAVTHVGAKIRDTAKVSLGCEAIIPASVLHQPARALYIGLHGTARSPLPGHKKHKDADTNMVSAGPVRPGAGGLGIRCQGTGSRGCEETGWRHERVYHELLAALSEYEPTMRNILAAMKKQGAAAEEFRQELEAVKLEMGAAAEVFSPSK